MKLLRCVQLTVLILASATRLASAASVHMHEAHGDHQVSAAHTCMYASDHRSGYTQTTCMACGGTGLCRGCHGSGQAGPRITGDGLWKTTMCGACHGTGTCQACHGCGYHLS